MNIEEFRNYILSKPGVTEDYPFGGECIWAKVMGKLFAITNIEEMKRGKEISQPFHFINLKCNPEKALELREKYHGVQPGWHQNKKHWNSIYTDRDLSDNLIYELIDHSYNLVVKSLTKKIQVELKNQ